MNEPLDLIKLDENISIFPPFYLVFVSPLVSVEFEFSMKEFPIWAQCYKTSLSVIHEFSQQARVLVRGKIFKPSLTNILA